MPDSPFLVNVKNVCGTLMKFAHSLKNGMHPKKVDSGILSMLVKHGKIALQNERNAINVGVNLTILPDENLPDFAQMHASLPGDDQPELITNGEYVERAGKNFSQASILESGTVRVSVVSTAPIKLKHRSPVYNLLVEDSHTFFANGILTHNCDALRYACRRIFRKAY
jgi:hypothetical protein